jgi:hypothetical protein
MEWSSGKAVFGHYDSSGHRSWVQSETVVQDGQWHYIVGTMQPAAGGGYLYRIYVDGKLDAEQVGSWAVEEAPAEGGILKIAYPNSTGGDTPFRGALDAIAIFDVALTPAQVKTRFEATRARPEPRTGVGQTGSGRRYPSRRPAHRAASRTVQDGSLPLRGSDKFKLGLVLRLETRNSQVPRPKFRVPIPNSQAP